MSGGTIARLATIAIALWLEAAPAVLGYAGTVAADVDRLLGPLVGGLAFVAIWPFIQMLRWTTIPVGVLLVAAPVLGYPAEAAVSSIASGVAVIALAFVSGATDRPFGGGWRVIWEGRRRQPAGGGPARR